MTESYDRPVFDCTPTGAALLGDEITECEEQLALLLARADALCELAVQVGDELVFADPDERAELASVAEEIEDVEQRLRWLRSPEAA